MLKNRIPKFPIAINKTIIIKADWLTNEAVFRISASTSTPKTI